MKLWQGCEPRAGTCQRILKIAEWLQQIGLIQWSSTFSPCGPYEVYKKNQSHIQPWHSCRIWVWKSPFSFIVTVKLLLYVATETVHALRNLTLFCLLAACIRLMMYCIILITTSKLTYFLPLNDKTQSKRLWKSHLNWLIHSKAFGSLTCSCTIFSTTSRECTSMTISADNVIRPILRRWKTVCLYFIRIKRETFNSKNILTSVEIMPAC